MKTGDDWLPVRIYWTDSGLKIDWAFLGDCRFSEPFFAETVERCFRNPAHLLFQKQTSVDALNEQTPGLPIRGFIFHSSRCGSTLITQTLAALPEHVVISEAAPIDILLRARLRNSAISESQQIHWLRGLLNALGQKRFADENALFVKFDAWHAPFLPLIRRAFPGVPCTFVYRDPLKTLLSHQRRRGGHVIPGVLEPELFGWTAEMVNLMNPGEYAARVIARIYEAGLENANTAACRLVNHVQLPHLVWRDLIPFWSLNNATQILDAAARVREFDSKNPTMPFVPPPKIDVTDEMRRLARDWMNDPYDRLEAMRRATPFPGELHPHPPS